MAARSIASYARSNPPSRSLSIAAGSACALVCLLVAVCSAGAAELEETDGADAATTPRPVDGDADVDELRPLALTPPAVRPLTPADLPPPNVFAAISFMRGASVNFGRDWRAGRDEYRADIEREALAVGLPPALLDAVMAVESRYNPTVVGMDGEIGLMQVMPATARMLGFTGTQAQLAEPEINIHYGAKYLAGAWRLAGRDLCTAAMKYRAGHGETRFSFRSVDYCVRVRNHLVARGVAVTGEVPRPTFGTQAGSGARGRSPSRISATGTVNLAALNARLRAVTDRIAPRNTH